MSSKEIYSGIDAIIEAHDTELSQRADAVAKVRGNLADAKDQVSVAEKAVEVARQNLIDAQQQVRNFENDKQAAEREVESEAKAVAIDIVDDTTIDLFLRTLYPLIYLDRRFAWQENPNAFRSAVERGRVALSAVMGRLQVDEPILSFDLLGNIVADKAKDGSLVATPPTKEVHASGYASLSGGTIDLVLPDAYSAKVTDYGLVQVKQKPKEVSLMSNKYQYDLDRLEGAASNANWLVIGHEAIAAKLENLDPTKRLVALTALQAVQIELSVELDEVIKQKTEDRLVALVAFLSAGTGQETTTRDVCSNSMWTVGRGHTQVTEDTPLSGMAKSVDKQSIKFTAQAIGLTKDALREKVEVVLRSRVESDTTSLDQLAKDLESLSNVDKTLDAIF